MAISFLDLVRKAREKFEGKRRSGTVAPLPSVEDKPQADKLAKRVMPNAVRTMTPEPTAPALAAASVMPTRRISLNRASPGVADDFGATGVAVEPRAERAVSLALSDIIAQMPHGYLKQGENFDSSRRVTLKAVDVEKGLATGRPSVAIAAIYQQVPEIFEHTVVPSDETVVVLPFQKVIDELSGLRVREDQTAETLSAQVETPFLKLMVEESAKFGTTVAPFEITELSIPLEPIANAPPAAEGAAAAGILPAPINPPTQPPPAPKASIAPPVQPAPAARIAITPPRTIPAPQIATEPNHDGSMARITSAPPADGEKNKPLPIGTGGSAFPRVPASSGPPVPPVAPPSIAPPPTVPTRIPFEVPPDAPPKVAIEKPAHSAPPVPRVPAPAPAPPVSQLTAVAATPVAPGPEPMVVLPLRPILQSLPPLQLAGDVASIPADVKISFRMATIAPQLASGKVVIPPKDFHAALPEQFRGLFLPDAVEAPVQLSLPDILANLPGDSLRMREDQEVVRQDEMFETPFLAKAKEDAQRFGETPVSAAARPKAEFPKVEAAKPQSSEATKAELATSNLQVPKVESPKLEAPKVEALRRSDQFEAPIVSTPSAQTAVAKPAEEAPKFDAKAAIAQACALSGVSHCSVNFADGLIIAGNIPAEMHVEGLSAVAPTMLNKLQKHMCETQLGALTCMTVYGENSPVTFFSAGNLCLTAVHNGPDLSAESRRELGRITQELSRTYPQTETPHVDH